MDITPEIRAAYAAHLRELGVGRIRIGCYLAMLVLPAGAIVDFFLHRDRFGQFLVVRLVFSLLMLPLMAFVSRPAGAQYHPQIGVVLAMIPAAAMAVIIHQAGGAESHYYAALNLVLLAIGLVLQWTAVQSLVAALAVLAMYLAATWSTVLGNEGLFFNNLWFLFLTGVIVVLGNQIQSRLRLRDFVSSYQLERSRRELERTNQRLRELDEIKGRFFANVSHELRTPLTLLLGPLESLRRHPAFAEPRVQETLATMEANGMRLLKLINDLLDLVRLDERQLQLHRTPVRVETFLRGVINAVKRFAEDRGLTVECRVDPGIRGLQADADKLEKVFLNLLFNSIKFTPAGGRIRVTARPDGAEAAFEVADTGRGIAPEHLPMLFSRFWQADSSTQRKYQGAGLGLALVKELVEAHDGTVSAESRPGSGTTMTVRLPMDPAAAEEPALGGAPADGPEEAEVEEEPMDEKDAWLNALYRRAELFASITPLRETLRPWAAPGTGRRPRALIADDEPDMLRFVHSQLEEDYDVIEAVDGEQAVTLAAQYLPDIVVCDLMLPGKDGLQVCRELRERESTRGLPFLMLTARADDETKLKSLAAGASDFLPKPFSLDELRVRLKNLVDANRMQRALGEQNKTLAATLEQLRDTELQLVQSEKMASLGRMSAGVIHEINNQLNFAKTGLYALKRHGRHIPVDQREDFDEVLRDIEEGVTRVAAIVADLRAFSHHGGGTIEEVNVAGTVDAALRFLAAEWRDRVEIDNSVPPDFVVPAGRTKLLQVIVNLLQNSLDALRDHPPAEGQPAITLRTDVRGGRPRLILHDNGPGIPQEHLSRIFDPFFTTKDVGEGTGLGLSICYRLMQEWDGRITVRTEPGRFCEFTLEFAGDLRQTARESALEESVRT